MITYSWKETIVKSLFTADDFLFLARLFCQWYCTVLYILYCKDDNKKKTFLSFILKSVWDVFHVVNCSRRRWRRQRPSQCAKNPPFPFAEIREPFVDPVSVSFLQKKDTFLPRLWNKITFPGVCLWSIVTQFALYLCILATEKYNRNETGGKISRKWHRKKRIRFDEWIAFLRFGF